MVVVEVLVVVVGGGQDSAQLRHAEAPEGVRVEPDGHLGGGDGGEAEEGARSSPSAAGKVARSLSGVGVAELHQVAQFTAITSVPTISSS